MAHRCAVMDETVECSAHLDECDLSWRMTGRSISGRSLNASIFKAAVHSRVANTTHRANARGFACCSPSRRDVSLRVRRTKQTFSKPLLTGPVRAESDAVPMIERNAHRVSTGQWPQVKCSYFPFQVVRCIRNVSSRDGCALRAKGKVKVFPSPTAYCMTTPKVARSRCIAPRGWLSRRQGQAFLKGVVQCKSSVALPHSVPPRLAACEQAKTQTPLQGLRQGHLCF